jgi:hypothetical protein
VTLFAAEIISLKLGGSPIAGPTKRPTGIIAFNISGGTVIRGGFCPPISAALSISSPWVVSSPPSTYDSPTCPLSCASMIPSATSSTKTAL